jgi:hypothetical protein
VIRKADDPKQVIDALLLEAPRDQGSAIDFAHGFPLVFCLRDYVGARKSVLLNAGMTELLFWQGSLVINGRPQIGALMSACP